MSKFEIKRNELDYILTDCNPVEISELFTYSYFYDFLLEKKEIVDITNKLKNIKKTKKCFDSCWSSKPLDYKIAKKDGSFRMLSLLQPLSILNLFFFIKLYGKDLLLETKKPLCSLRHHKRNSSLYYVGKSDKHSGLYEYINKGISPYRVLEQSGTYFDIIDYQILPEFTKSDQFKKLKAKYKYILKLDYKDCFRSIYTHSFNWICTDLYDENKNISKKPILFSEIDRTLQNINCHVTNGIVVGPEFSRLCAELLLQKIDKNIILSLENKGYVYKKDVEFYRFIDDVFIFYNNEESFEHILSVFRNELSRFELSINEQKIRKTLSNNFIDDYVIDLEILKQTINNLFKDTTNNKNQEEHVLYLYPEKINRIENLFDAMMSKFPSNRTTIVSYSLSIIFNRLNQNNNELPIFLSETPKVSKDMFLDLLFHILSYAISFSFTQKVVGILYFLNKELNFKENPFGLQKVVNKYSNYFKNAYINDYINLFLILSSYNVFFQGWLEEQQLNKILDDDDPVNLATFLVYSKSNNDLFNEVNKEITKKIDQKIIMLYKKENLFEFRDFWYFLIFNNCPLLENSTKLKINKFLNSNLKIKTGPNLKPWEIASNLVVDFLQHSGQNFITWNLSTFDISRQITFRTNYKTIFYNKSNIEDDTY